MADVELQTSLNQPPSSTPKINSQASTNNYKSASNNYQPTENNYQSSTNTYQNYIKPQVKQHFNQMQLDKQINQGGGNGGGGYQPTTTAQNRARTASRVGPGGNVKAYGLADGGLIDLYRYGGFI